jgi:xylulokinase
VLRVIGGGALGHPWMQILADVTGKRIEPVRNPQEAGAVGAAMTAAVGLGIYKDFESLKNVVSSDIAFEPRAANCEVYDFLYPLYKELYTDLKGFYTRINKERCEQV